MEGTEESSELMLMNFHSINHPTQTHNQENGIALTCTFDGNIILNLYLLLEKFGQAIRLLQSAYTEKTSEYEHVINELQKQLYDKSDYVQRLEKRNAELEKQIIDTQSRLKEAEARIGYKDGRIRELEVKCEGLDKIRKDIINTVSAASGVSPKNNEEVQQEGRKRKGGHNMPLSRDITASN